jgi:high-affinity nickel-transport protein
VIALFAIAWLVSVVLYRRMFAAPNVLDCADATKAA